jgi:hypothetical protein
MKTMKQLVIVLAAFILAAGCAKSNSQNQATPNTATNTGVVAPVVIDPAAPTSTASTQLFSSGSTSAFTPVSLSVMNTYVATHPLNNPSNFQINMNLATSGASRYGGNISISYTDNGVQYNGVFKAGMGSNQTFPGMYDNGVLEANYNFWFNSSSQLVFSGVFEDQYGAITVTLVPESTSTCGGNDAEPCTTSPYKGYVYFKNFATTPAPHGTQRSCWFIYTGPYDCRSNVIATKSGLFPGAEAGYQLLGTFGSVNVNKAFNIQ